MRATTLIFCAVVALLIMSVSSNYMLYKSATPQKIIEVSRHIELQQFLVDCFDEQDEGHYTVAYVSEYPWDLAEEIQLCDINVFN